MCKTTQGSGLIPYSFLHVYKQCKNKHARTPHSLYYLRYKNCIALPQVHSNLNRVGTKAFLGSADRHLGFQTYQRFGVTEYMILEELVQHIEEVVMHQGLYNQLIQIMLEKSQKLH